MEARHIQVRGVVQGVGFRASAQREAQARGLVGWVRNRPDGSVEAWVQGAAADVAAFLAWCQRGPPGAQVDALATVPEAADLGMRGFAVRRTG